MQIEFLIGLLIVPLLVGVLAIALKGSRQVQGEIDFAEWVVISLIGIVVFLGGWSMATSSNYTDTEFLNGRIAMKDVIDVSCHHCRNVCDAHDEKGNCTSSHEECDHDHDIYFFARTDYYQYFPHEGEVSYGTYAPGTPPPVDWTAVTIGDPATTLHRYTNWLRGAGKQSLLFPYSAMTDSLAKSGLFPSRIFEYFNGKYYAPKAFLVDGGVNSITDTSAELMQLNAKLGTEKQGNLQLFFVQHQPMEYANAYMDFTHGGAKNDIDTFVGLDGDQITWVAVRYGLPGFDQTDESTGGSNTLVETSLRAKLGGSLNKAGGYTGVADLAYAQVMQYFDRVPNKQFAYLEKVQKPDGTQLAWIYAGLVFLAVVAGVAALQVELEEVLKG